MFAFKITSMARIPLAWLLMMGAHPEPAHADTMIYEAFEEKFSTLERRLADLQKLGFSHVVVSPPQKSLDRPEWWARYQPIDYEVINGPLGDQADLLSLCQAADKLGVAIIVDAVLNHMADARYFPRLEYPQFKAEDFHSPQRCIEDFSNRLQAVTGWLCDERAVLPDLKTESPHVRRVQLHYLKTLVGLGVDGFRFDAAVNMESDYFSTLTKELPAHLFYLGEVVGTRREESLLYAQDMRLTDFWLLRDLISIFQADHSLRRLKELPSGQDNLGPDNIAFVRTHDGLFHKDFFNFDDDAGLGLAYAYILTAGFPNAYVLNQDMERDDVKAALKFRQMTQFLPTAFLDDTLLCEPFAPCREELAAWTRGDQGWVLINNSRHWQTLSNLQLPLPGKSCYQEIRYGFSMCLDEKSRVESWAGQARVTIGPRTALFFVSPLGGLRVGENDSFSGLTLRY